MLPPDKLQKAFKRVEEENWMLRAFLKGQDPDEVDNIVHNLHKELFEDYDCIACSNCCKAIAPIVKGKEIKVISAQFKLTAAEFKNKYLIKTDEGFIINKKPCPFLAESGCSVYEHRPANCREYPFTDKEEILTRLINLVENCAVCPVVFELFERLKKHYSDEFESYKVEYEEIWGNEDEYEYDDEYDDMEEWEADAEFFDQEDWEGLVEYRRQKAEKYPDDSDCQWSLGEAYVLNKEYEKAINILDGLHKKYPDNPNIQHSLLDALFAIGKDETAINWIIKPSILRLDNNILDYCYNFLKKKRKPRTVHELYLELYCEGYPAFDDNQLMDFLLSDNRFTITGSTDKSYDCYISIIKR